MNSNMILTVLNLHQKIPKGATTKIQVYETYKKDKIVSHIPVNKTSDIEIILTFQ